MKKLTKEELKSTLNYCSNPQATCEKCILYDPNDDDCQCSRDLKRAALKYIESLEEESFADSSVYSEFTFGEKLRAVREARGLSQLELSHISGVAPHSICNYEHDRYEPTFFNFKALCRALNVSSDIFLKG